jgi:hypothetical protein
MASRAFNFEDMNPFLTFWHEMLGIARFDALRRFAGGDAAFAAAQVYDHRPLPVRFSGALGRGRRRPVVAFH